MHQLKSLQNHSAPFSRNLQSIDKLHTQMPSIEKEILVRFHDAVGRLCAVASNYRVARETLGTVDEVNIGHFGFPVKIALRFKIEKDAEDSAYFVDKF